MTIRRQGLSRVALIFLAAIISWHDPFFLHGATRSEVRPGRLAAATYYVDATGGNDHRDGRTPETAWRSIARVNSSSFNPGDSILFKRGETWSEGTGLNPGSSGWAGE